MLRELNANYLFKVCDLDGKTFQSHIFKSAICPLRDEDQWRRSEQVSALPKQVSGDRNVGAVPTFSLQINLRQELCYDRVHERTGRRLRFSRTVSLLFCCVR